MLKALITTIALIVLTITAAACSPLKPVAIPKQSTYALGPGIIKATRGNAASPITLLVLIPEASPGYTTADMIYTLESYQLQEFANHRWIAPPAHMLLPLLVQRLQGTRHFNAVVGTPFSGSAQYRLATQLLELRQDFSEPVSVERMAMSAQLIDNHTQKVIASQTFKAAVAAPGNNPQSGVAAANRATQSILQQVSRFVVSRI